MPTISTAPFRATPIQYGETSVVRLSGELDVAAAPELWSRLAPVVESRPGYRPPQLVLDLSALDFLDAAGLGAIVRLDNKIQSAGGSIRIRSPKPLVRRVLELTYASQRLQVETEESPRREECRHG